MKKKKIFNEQFFAILEMILIASVLGTAYLLGHYDSIRYHQLINEKLSNCYEICCDLCSTEYCIQKNPIGILNFTILKNSSGNTSMQNFS